MAQELLAQSAREFFQNPRLLEAVVHHPVLAVTAAFWISVAYGSAQIAVRKGRDDQVWGTLALLFSVVPLIVLLVLPRRADAQTQAAPTRCGG